METYQVTSNPCSSPISIFHLCFHLNFVYIFTIHRIILNYVLNVCLLRNLSTYVDIHCPLLGINIYLIVLM